MSTPDTRPVVRRGQISTEFDENGAIRAHWLEPPGTPLRLDPATQAATNPAAEGIDRNGVRQPPTRPFPRSGQAEIRKVALVVDG